MKRRLVGISSLLLAALLTPSCATNNVSLGPGLEDAGQPDSGTAPSGSFIPTPDPDGGETVTVDAGVPPTETVKACIGTECTWPHATCDDGAVARCNVDLLTDNNNCGACGHVCSNYAPLYVATRCSNGQCKPFCSQSGLLDCNGLIDDGCETQIAIDANNCGSCGNKCADGQPCNNGVCGCAPGQVICNGQCVDIASDRNNCGACGNVCPIGSKPCDPKDIPPNSKYTCSQGVCGKFVCNGGFADCNGDMAFGCGSTDGCETDIIYDANNCGGCGNKCAPGQFCRLGPGGRPTCLCGPGETACGAIGSPTGNIYCYDLSNDPNNCGACGHVCPTAPNATAVCKSGICGLKCPANRADCNGSWADGCEIDLLTNMNNCGACGNACDSDAGQPCINGSCLMVECDAGGVGDPH
ncbi:Tryptophan synthase alpha chain [Labilithrix luteola]|uniref:Tryptophan synthase alpha chain n=1 Tax=Labilithrix luteola TaxID=1391654 RepID=A0A0K1PNI1_9BACT|nr:hypothetical protein [Labilithrix luteola]AKU95072.1 Tryptophan synthase alpha chain [Labilithrix luteola]